MVRQSILVVMMILFMFNLSSTSNHNVTIFSHSKNGMLFSQDSVIVIGTTDSVEASIDPAQSYDFFGWTMISCVSSGLVEIIPGTSASSDDIRGALASSWTRSADGLEWTFNLREGLIFYDGKPFNASCVKWSFERNIGMALAVGPQLNIGYSNIIDEITVVDEYTIRFDLYYSFSPFLQLLSCPASFITHPDYKDDADYVHYNELLGPRSNHPNDLGPFVLTEWDRVGGVDSMMRLEANPNYWGQPDVPKADVIIYQFYSSDTALASALTAGDIDFAYRHLTPLQVDYFRDNTNFAVHEENGAAIQYLLFQQEIEPYGEQEIRQGIAAALNKTNLAYTVFQDTAIPLYSIIPDGIAYHKPSFEIYGEANYTFTQEMLALHGYDEGNKLEVNLYYESSGHYPYSAEQAALYKSNFEASGVIEVTLHSYEWSTYRQQRNAGTMDLFIYGWYPDYIDPDNYAFIPFALWLNLGFNNTYGGVEQYNLWVQARSVPDDEREGLYYELQDLQAEQCSCVPLWQKKITAVSKANIEDVVFDITEYSRPWLFKMKDYTTTTTTITSSTATTSTTTTTTTSTTTTTALSPFDGDWMTDVSMIVTLGSVIVIVVFTILIIKSKKQIGSDSFSI